MGKASKIESWRLIIYPFIKYPLLIILDISSINKQKLCHSLIINNLARKKCVQQN